MEKGKLNKEKKRNDLLDAAYKLFTVIGYSETTITQIAKKAGVAKGTFYLYFKSKEDIREALIIIKSREIFQNAINNLSKHLEQTKANLSICDKIIFITDDILTVLSKNIALLKYIYKSLSWGLFSKPFLTADKQKELLDFRTYTKNMLKKEGVVLKNFDLVIYTIVELINSTCYNIILNGEPVTFSDYKPFLFKCIRLIIEDELN